MRTSMATVLTIMEFALAEIDVGDPDSDDPKTILVCVLV